MSQKTGVTNMVRKTKQEAENTRTTILSAAIQVLLTRGLARTHIDDIARAAGLTRGAIYWHFANKAALFNTLWEDLIDRNDFIFQVTGGNDEFDPLGYLVERLFIFLEKMPANAQRRRLFQLFLNEGILLQLDHVFSFDQKKFQRQRIKNIETLLQDAVDKRQLPANIDTFFGAIAIVSYVDGLTPQYQQLVSDLEIKMDASFLINGLMQMIRFGCVCHVCT
jgi:TetR/AcrR family acrAB operon transcriptional repressor